MHRKLLQHPLTSSSSKTKVSIKLACFFFLFKKTLKDLLECLCRQYLAQRSLLLNEINDLCKKVEPLVFHQCDQALE